MLDVGCGGWQDRQVFIQLKGPNVIHLDLDQRARHLEIQGDAHVLPFPDQTFSVIYASHILEHLQHPIVALREWKRCARVVVINVPNVVTAYGTENVAHLYNWNIWTLRQLCEQVFDHVEVEGSTRFLLRDSDPFLKKFLIFWVTLPLRLRPNQLTAICR